VLDNRLLFALRLRLARYSRQISLTVSITDISGIVNMSGSQVMNSDANCLVGLTVKLGNYCTN